MKRPPAYFIIILFAAVVFSSCSKESIERSQVNGCYAIKYPFPNIVLELKKGKCIELYLETQDGLSFRTTAIQSSGEYPIISYSCTAEGETSGSCVISASFASPELFNADISYYITSGEGLGAISWAGNIEKMEFNRQTE